MNPYSNLPKSSFWKSGVVEDSQFTLFSIYNKKFSIAPNWKIATAGSCFAQHISRTLKASGFSVLDEEPAPNNMPQPLHSSFGYSMYSARYGNIYTIQQLLQLLQEVDGTFQPKDIIWEKDNKHYDALRPAIEPQGFESKEEALIHRRYHLEKVKNVFLNMDLFIFTFGLTEAWVHNIHHTVYPTAPGVIAGNFSSDEFSFKNFSFYECINAFNKFQTALQKLRGTKSLPRIILTVSPVALTATASNNHILSANTYSKSILRSVAGHLADHQHHIDYFPSYEIVTNPSSRHTFFKNNLREVRPEGVDTVMNIFLSQHMPNSREKQSQHQHSSPPCDLSNDIQCEEALLETFNS